MSDPNEQSERAPPATLGADLIIPVLALAFTLYFLVDASTLVWEARANGTAIATVLLMLIAVQIARTVISHRAGRGSWSFGEFSVIDSNQKMRLGLIAILVIFMLALEWIGTTLGVFLVMASSMWLLGVREKRMLFAVSFGTAATVWLLFIAFLSTRLPHGPIEKLLAPLLQMGI